MHGRETIEGTRVTWVAGNNCFHTAGGTQCTAQDEEESVTCERRLVVPFHKRLNDSTKRE